MEKRRKTAMIAAGALIILAVVIVVLYFTLRPEPTRDEKTITVEITHLDGGVKIAEITTNEGYLLEAMRQEGLIDGDQTEFGFWVTSVDGYLADEDNEEWWGHTRDGEYVPTGIDLTVISDGDHYEFTLNVGYDGFE